MARRKRSAVTWSACKAVIKHWPASKLAELVHELYQLGPDNRRFLHARLLPEANAQTVDQAASALRKMLSVPSVYDGRFRHADAKQIVDQFAKATDDRVALCDLLIHDLEISFRTFNQVGRDERMVDHLYATLFRLQKTSMELSTESLEKFAPRMKELGRKWGDQFGYGISDELRDVVADWLERAGGRL